MADYPTKDGNNNTIIASPGSSSDRVGYPVLDGLGNTIIAAPGFAFRPGYPVSNALGQVLIPAPGWTDDKIGYPVLDGLGNIIIPAPGYTTGTIPLKGDEEVVAKGGVIPAIQYTMTGSNTTLEGRTEIVFGRQKCNELRVTFVNAYLSSGMKDNANDVVYEASIERIDVPQKFVFRWDGAALFKNAAPGQRIMSEAVLSSLLGYQDGFPEGSKWRVRVRQTCALLGKICVQQGLVADLAGENLGVVHNGTTSQIDATGDLTVPAGGTLVSTICPPTMIIGRWVDQKDISILQLDDSVGVGTADSGDTGLDHGGWFAIGTRNPGGHGQIPCSRAARSGEQLRYLAADLNDYRWYMATFHTHAQCGMGGADGLNSRTYAQIVADLQIQYPALRLALKRHKKVIERQTQPLTTSTDGWATPADNGVGTNNQTAVAGLGTPTTGLRDQANAYKVANLGTSIGPDYIFDPNEAWQCPSTSPDLHWCWRAGRAQDSSHPNETGQHEAGALYEEFWEDLESAPVEMSAAFALSTTMTAVHNYIQAMGAAFSMSITMSANHGIVYNSSADFTLSTTLTANYTYSEDAAAAFQMSISMAAVGTYAQNISAAFSLACTMAAVHTYTQAMSAAFNMACTMAAAYTYTPPGGFEPNSLTGFLAWLDAGNYVTHSSNVVTAWDNKYDGSSTYGAVQGGTSTLRPTLSTYNGIPIVNFDGGDWMTWNLPSNLHASGNAFTIVFVYRKTNLGVGNQYVYGYNDTGTGYYGGMGVGNDGTHKWSVGGNGSQTALVAGGGNNNLHFLTSRCTVGAQIRGALDGGTEQVGTGNFGAVAATTNFQLGRESKTPGSYFTGGIVGALAFNSYLSDADLNTLCNYLETYYDPSSGDAVWTNV